jgi:hypothetical protein
MHIEDYVNSLLVEPRSVPQREPNPQGLQHPSHELVLVYPGITEREIAAVKWGKASFALVVEPPLILLCFRFGDAIGWSIAPCPWNQNPGAGGMLANENDLGMVMISSVCVSLIDASTSVTRAQRVVPLSRSMSRAWVASMRRQSLQHCSNARYRAALAQFCRRFPRPDTLVAQAIASSVDGE